MAYINQELKRKLAPAIKAVLAKYGMKGTLGISNHSTLHVRISSGKLDVIANSHDMARLRSTYSSEFWSNRTYLQVSQHHMDTCFSGKVLTFMQELFAAANAGNWDKSDSMSDYHDVGWYTYVNIGSWDKPYTVVA